MIELALTFNYWLALGTIAMQAATAYILIEYFFLKRQYLVPYLQRFGLWIVLGLSAASVVLSLVYSEVFGFVPCGLCWLQRIFLYPLPIIAALAIWKRDAMGALYIMWLSGVGAAIALYQHYLQMGGSELLACPRVGEGADCARRILFEFGYITFPLMAFSTFLFIMAVLLVYRSARGNHGR